MEMLFDSLLEAEEKLRDLEIETNTRYISVSSTKSFGNIKTDVSKKRVSWTEKGYPIIILGKKVLECHHGKDRNLSHKEKLKKEKEGKSDDLHSYARKGRFLAQPTKKLDCPAKVLMKEILFFPNVEVESCKRSRARASAALRRCLENGEKKFMVVMPELSDHMNHSVGELAGLSQRLDQVGIDNIQELVDDGVTNPEEVKRHLDIHVRSSGEKVSDQSRRFFPTVKIIRNYMASHERTNIKTDDQEN